MDISRPPQANAHHNDAPSAPHAPTQPAGPAPAINQGGYMQTKSKKPWIIIAVVILVVLVALCAAFMSWKAGTGDGAIKKNQYQAVFLTNGQVYFCKLSSVTSTYVTCKDIYYLQVQQSVQPAEQTDANKPQVQLAKLGSELHGPEDEMQISRDQVLFWENLKDNSKVVDAIKKNTTKQ